MTMEKTRQPPLLLLSVFSTFEVGGPQVRFAAIANHFGQRFRHVIVAMDGVFDCKDRLSPQLDVTLQAVANRKGQTFANRMHFRRELRSIQPDCLVTYNWGAIEWAMANWPRLTPHIHIEDGFGPEESRRQLWRRVLTRRFMLRGSTVAVPSRRLERIATDIWKLKPSTVRYIPNGIDCARFARTGIDPWPARDGRKVIGTVAALRQEKNLLRLIESFALARKKMSCRLVIAGDGPERPVLEARVAELGLSNDVTFAGYRQDSERIYAGLDVFMLTSDTEQMPTTIIEAMAAGLPVVSTDVGDVATMLSGENRQFVVPADGESLARATLEILAQDDLRMRLGTANQVRANLEFSQERMFEAYGQLLEEHARQRI